jgi:hypothetical protein
LEKLEKMLDKPMRIWYNTIALFEMQLSLLTVGCVQIPEGGVLNGKGIS